MFEKQIDQIYGKKGNIELQIMTLEGASGNNDVLKAMKFGAEALKKSVKDTDVEKVADVMEDINESMGLADELGEALSQPIGPVMDEDELNAELEEMENELDDADLLKAPVVPSGAPVINALSTQRRCIINIFRACVGLTPENDMLLEHKTNFRISPSQHVSVSQQNNVNIKNINHHQNHNETKQLKQNSKKRGKTLKTKCKTKKD